MNEISSFNNVIPNNTLGITDSFLLRKYRGSSVTLIYFDKPCNVLPIESNNVIGSLWEIIVKYMNYLI